MTGGGPIPHGSRYTHNDAAFVEYKARLQSSTLSTFTSAASKFTEWLGSDKAYYPNARAPIVSIIESAHANICNMQGDPSTPFTFDKALPGLDLWYQPYLSLLKQAGSHLNHFEPDLRARLQLLVENAGIKIVQVPTITENIGTHPKQSTERKGDHATATGIKESPVPVGALSYSAGPTTQVQEPGIFLTTGSEPQRKGRRKLNRAIFDIDTAAALRTRTQLEYQTVETNELPPTGVAVQQKSTNTTHPPVSPSEGASGNLPLVSNTMNKIEDQSEFPSNVDGHVPSIAVGGPSCNRTEDFKQSETTNDKQSPGMSSVCVPRVEITGNNVGLDDDRQPEHFRTAVITNEEKSSSSGAHSEDSSEPMARVVVHIPQETETETKAEALQQPEDEIRIAEQPNVNKGVYSNSQNDIAVHGIVRRRTSDETMGEEQRSLLEPPTKRIRTEPEASTAVVSSMPTSQVATPGVEVCNPPDPTSSASLSVIHGIQRSGSDMILESDNEATPPPRPSKSVGDGGFDDGPPPPEERPLLGSRITPAVEPDGGHMIDETSMPPIQDLSLASPAIKPNPFTTCMLSLDPPHAPPLVRPTIMPDVGSLSLQTPVIDAAQAPDRGNQLQKTYIFSAAEIRTLFASRGSDEGSGPNKLVFYLDWDLVKRIAKWRNFKTGQGPLEGSLCLSLACYPVDSVAALMSAATGNEPFDVLIRQAHIKSSWPSCPTFRSKLKDLSGKSYAIPPFSTTDDDFIDISESAVPGSNTFTIEDNGQGLSNWLFAVYVHTPTIAYFDAVKAMVDKEKRWVDTLSSFTTFSLPAVNWDALQSHVLS